jgi:hypothetical protein
MSSQVQFRRGTTTQNNAFTGAQGEITYDTDVKTLRLHDGTTAGGGATVVTLAASQSLLNKTMSTGSVWSGNAIALGYGGTGSSLTATAGAIAYSTSSGLALNAAGTSGQILQSAGTGTPIWVNASALTTGTATSSITAQNILGGSAGYLVYQQDTDTTSFIAPGTTGYILKSTGASTAPTWVTPDFTLGTTSVAVGTTETNFTGINTFYITGTTDASSSSTGVLRVAGGASVTKNLYVGGNTVITGNLTVNGTTTTINSTTYTVDDKNIELGSVDTPTNTTANGGGITLKGDTDKTIIWDSANSNWTSSEHWNIASGKSFKIATVPVLTSTTVLNDSSQTSIGIGGYATTISIGASTGATTINHELDVTGNAIITGDLQVKGGDFTVDSGSSTFNLVNTNATTLNIGGAATSVNIGNATSATATIRPGTVVGSNTTQNLYNTVATTVNAFGAATAINIGANSGTVTIGNPTVVGTQTTQNLWNATATTVNAFGAATTISLGASTGKTTFNSTDDASSNSSGAITVAGGVSIQKKLYVGSDTVLTGDLQVKGGDITTDQTTFNLLNTTATTINFGGASTSTAIGSTSSGTTTIGYDLTTNGDVQIKGGDLTTNQTTFNVINTTATTVNAFGAATTIGIGASTGTLTVNNAQTIFNSTSTIQVPVGTTAQRPTAATGQVRYNTDLHTFEGYADSAWGSLGGVKSVDGLTYIIPETSPGASNDELEFYTATDGSNTAKRGGWNKTRLLVNTPILVSSQASLSEYPNALIISSNGDTTNSEVYIAGVVGEGVASGSDTTKWGVGVYGAGTSNGSTKSAGVIGKGIVYSTSDTGSAVGVRGLATDTHASGLNVGLYSDASGSAVNNYALYMNTGDIFSGAAQTWLLKDNVSSALSLDATGKTGILKVITTDSAEGVTMSGTLSVTGDFKVNTNKFTVTASSGNTSLAGTLAVTGDQTNTGDLAVNGGDLTTTSTTATLFNTNATTLNIGGAATTINIGSAASGAATNVGKDLYVAGNLYVTGTQSTGSISTISGADSAIYTNAGAAGNTNDIGLIGTYVSSGTKYTGLLRDHADSVWKFYSTSTAPSAGTTQSFTGATYDAVKMGALTATNGTFSAALTYGGVTLSNSVTGTGSMVLSASPTITGHATIEGVTATGATGTGKFVFDTSPTISGHPTIEGVTSTGATGTGAFVFGNSPSLTTPNLGVASATTINKVTITAPATGSTLTIADGKTLTASNSLTFTGTDGSSVAFGAGGTAAYTTDTQYIGTTAVTLSRASANLALTGISSVTLPGFSSGTVQIIPTAAVGTGTVLTIPATTGTIVTTGDSGTVTNTMLAGSIANAKLTNSSVTFGNTAVSLGSSSTSISGLTSITFAGSTSGTTQLLSGAVAGTSVLTLPVATDTLAGIAATQTLTNKTISGSSNTLSNIGNSSLTNSSVTFNGVAVALGSSGTITATATNALTIGTGLSGSSYNGSTAVTIALATAYGDTTNPYASKTANYFLAAPNGSAGTPSFRAIVAADIPTLNQNTTGTAGGLTGTPNITVGTISSGALTVTGAITATTSITAYYSDDRLKTKTGNIQNALEKVLSLDGFHYHANEVAVALGYDASIEEVGLSAQQVKEVLPEVIAPAPIDPQYMTIHYDRVIPLLVEAIKEQQKQIEELKAKLGN